MTPARGIYMSGIFAIISEKENRIEDAIGTAEHMTEGLAAYGSADSGYEILELARTGVAGLGRGTKNIIYINDLRLGAGISDGPDGE